MQKLDIQKQIDEAREKRFPKDKYMLATTKETPPVHLGTLEAVQLSVIPEDKRLSVWTDWCIFEKKQKFNSGRQRQVAREQFFNQALELINRG